VKPGLCGAPRHRHDGADGGTARPVLHPLAERRPPARRDAGHHVPERSLTGLGLASGHTWLPSDTRAGAAGRWSPRSRAQADRLGAGVWTHLVLWVVVVSPAPVGTLSPRRPEVARLTGNARVRLRAKRVVLADGEQSRSV
jgi:hypothetical protein